MTGEITALPDRELTMVEVLLLAEADGVHGAEPRRLCPCGVNAVDVLLEDRMVHLEYEDGRWRKI